MVCVKAGSDLGSCVSNVSKSCDFDVDADKGKLGSGVDCEDKSEDGTGLEGELGSLNQIVERVVTSGKGKGKGKLGLELELVPKDEQGCLRLRSGKKVGNGRGGGRGCFGDENAGGAESVNEEGVKEEGPSEMIVKVESGGGDFNALKDPQQQPAAADDTRTNANDDCVEGSSIKKASCEEVKEKGNAVDNALLSSCFDAMDLDSPDADKSDEMANGPKFDTSSTLVKAEKRLSREEKGKGKVHQNGLSISPFSPSELDLPTVKNSEEMAKIPTSDTNGSSENGSRRLSRHEKGKAKVVENGVMLEVTEAENSSTANVAVQEGPQVLENVDISNVNRTRERFRNIARKNASRFAHFASNEEEDEHRIREADRNMPPTEVDKEIEDWPGPFSTAMKIIKDRQSSGNVQQPNSSLNTGKYAPVIWVPKKDHNPNRLNVLVPSLQDLCLTILAKNVDAITSLDCVPDVLRHKLSHKLCDARRMNNHFFDLLVKGSPAEIRVRDCSWLTEEHFSSTFEGADLSKLLVWPCTF